MDGQVAAPQLAGPGALAVRRIDHPGFTVPDLAEAVAFFVDVLGLERRLAAGPVIDPELLEFRSPGQDTTPPRNSDSGGRHLALEVDDVQAATELLRATPGVRVIGRPETLVTGPGVSVTTLYFVAPWGMYLELVHRTGAT